LEKISEYYRLRNEEMMDQNQLEKKCKIGIIGGTGKEGKGLAFRWAKAGYQIFIGSRQTEKAILAVEDLRGLLPDGIIISGATNEQVAQMADIVVVTVPYSAHLDILNTIKPFVQGKIVIDVTVPLVPPKVSQVVIPAAGSAAQEAQQVLGDGVRVVSAFQNISYEKLLKESKVNCDVLVCGNDKNARSQVIELVKEAGMVGWNAGPIQNAIVAEGLTSILIGINKEHGVHSAGIRITGVAKPRDKSK
jgi:NADPH-dependent F420 reductase